MENLETANYQDLTKRQAEVLKMVSTGKTSGEVAKALYVSKRTIDFHLAEIFDKFRVGNRIEAINVARRIGILQ